MERIEGKYIYLFKSGKTSLYILVLSLLYFLIQTYPKDMLYNNNKYLFPFFKSVVEVKLSKL